MWATSESLAVAEINAAYGGQRGLHPNHRLSLQEGEQVLQVGLEFLLQLQALIYTDLFQGGL